MQKRKPRRRSSKVIETEIPHCKRCGAKAPLLQALKLTHKNLICDQCKAIEMLLQDLRIKQSIQPTVKETCRMGFAKDTRTRGA